MIRKKCYVCGKWVNKIDSVKSSLGKSLCSECYHVYKDIVEHPYIMDGCEEDCFKCERVDECLGNQIERRKCTK